MAGIEIPEGLEDLFQQTWFDHVLHYGLLLGAVFQLVCIAAIIVIPPSPEEESDTETSGPGPHKEGSSSSDVGDVSRSTGVAGGGLAKKGGKKARKRK